MIHNINNNDECVICFEQYEAKSLLAVIQQCHHIFHEHCIMDAFKYKLACPMCRNENTALLHYEVLKNGVLKLTSEPLINRIRRIFNYIILKIKTASLQIRKVAGLVAVATILVLFILLLKIAHCIKYIITKILNFIVKIFQQALKKLWR